MHVDVGDIDQKYTQNVSAILNHELLIGSWASSIAFLKNMPKNVLSLF